MLIQCILMHIFFATLLTNKWTTNFNFVLAFNMNSTRFDWIFSASTNFAINDIFFAAIRIRFVWNFNVMFVEVVTIQTSDTFVFDFANNAIVGWSVSLVQPLNMKLEIFWTTVTKFANRTGCMCRFVVNKTFFRIRKFLVAIRAFELGISKNDVVLAQCKFKKSAALYSFSQILQMWYFYGCSFWCNNKSL